MALPDPEHALARAIGALPGGGEGRAGQQAMATAVAAAIGTGRHLVVQAGTGTGKSLAYLVPAIVSGKRVVVATATKALQDQLATKDLPFLAEHLGVDFSFAVLKGRSNYVCVQRLQELAGDGQLAVDDGMARSTRREVDRLVVWAASGTTGDLAELDWAPSVRAAQAVTVTAEECPGAARCPSGEACFAEAARRRASQADVVVVNTHLYGTHLAAGGGVLGPHDVLVVDEAHQLEDTISATAGLSIGPGRTSALARRLGGLLAEPAVPDGLTAAGASLASALTPWHGKRLPRPLPATVTDALVLVRARVDAALAALRAIDTSVDEAVARRRRAQQVATGLANELVTALALTEAYAAWVDGPADAPRLEVAPIDVADVLAPAWAERTAILTSATIPAGLAARAGLPADRTEVLDVGSPFDYANQAVLYCALGLPVPGKAGRDEAVHEELAALITAAGGRTLALFTSYRAMEAAVAALKPQLPYRLLAQTDLPKPALVRAFADDETACLFATAGFFQGIDVPGRSLSLVTIDRLPFPRPDDPLLEARRERARADAFRVVDLPRAATLLAQAAGRLVRSKADRGVVAVLDPRLGTAPYRWEVVRALPPMRRTRHRADVELFLKEALAA